MKNKLFKALITLSTMLLIPTLAIAYSVPIENGLSWLSVNQNPDGSWGSDYELAVLNTSTVLDTLGYLNNNGSVYSNGVAWLIYQSSLSTDYLSRKVKSLYMSGVDVSIDLSTLSSNRNADGVWGGDTDSTSMIIDTALALQALKAVSYSNQDIISFALYYLTANQNADGGWGFYAGDESNVYMTAVVLNTLSQFNTVYDLQAEINNAVVYLLTKQNADGGFGSSPSTVYETALSTISLIESGQGSALPIQNAINYLLATQLANGSWNDDAYSTALALRALANVKPNLTISSSDITFSKSVPAVGETITITANIRNTALDAADNVVVQFYYGDPASGGILIGETTIASVNAGVSLSSSISWTVNSNITNKIYVLIDPLNSVDELNEADNISSRSLTGSTIPDLIVSTADIEIFPPAPEPYVLIGIYIKVRNLGETDAANVSVDVFDGDPASGGVRLQGGGVIPYIPGGGVAEIAASIESAYAVAGTKQIYVIADMNNSISESDESNNAAVKQVRIGGSFADLAIAGNSVSWSPIYPEEGALVPITAVISNHGEAAAEDVLVRFYLGDPDLGGTQIGTDVILPAIASGNSANTTVNWDSTGHAGKNTIYIKVDPLGVVQEPNELDNMAFVTIDIADSTGANLMVSYGEISFAPSAPVTGERVTISALVRNNSSKTLNNITVEFGDGDPREPGTTIIGRATIPLLYGTDLQSGATVTFEWDTAGLSGTHEIYVNADPFNEIVESDEKDNIAYAAVEIGGLQGADLKVASIDTANLVTDTQSLQVAGMLGINIENIGSQSTGGPFEIAAFEDRNRNGKLDLDSDNLLGTVLFNSILSSGSAATIDLSVSGTVLFRDNLIHVMANSASSIMETDMTNNIRHTGQVCENTAACNKFDVEQKFAWHDRYDSSSNVYITPLVANMTDDNGDTLINEADIPDIIFYPSWSSSYPIKVISGDDGRLLKEFPYVSAYLLQPYTQIAAGDIDNNGLIEIIGLRNSNPKALVAFNNDGSAKWLSDPIAVPTGNIQRWAVSIADLEGDGAPEIISGPNVLDNMGKLRWSVPVYDGISLVADLDMDGVQEVIIGGGAYRSDGTVYWKSSLITVAEVGHAVANLDDDVYPEVVQVVGSTSSNMKVYCFDHDGALKWGPVKINDMGWPSSPAVGDFNGDGKPELAISGHTRFTVLDGEGNFIWESTTHDSTWGGISAAVFDFDGDGAAEIVYNDMQYLRIYNGRNGEILYSTPNSSATITEYPVVADVDNDGSAEIIVYANFGYTYTYRGIRVFQNTCDSWQNTRKIWNEYNYHITNVNDDGTIPVHEQNNWEIYNNYRQNLALPGNIHSKADITVSHVSIDQTMYPSSVRISARIGNGGASSPPEGIDIDFYDGDPAAGGQLIGTAETTKALYPGNYEDVSIVWDMPPSGDRDIYVVADEGNDISECRESNNAALATFNIGGEIQTPKPDLMLSLTDLIIEPQSVIEGQSATISATVHNTGSVGAFNVNIFFYDGDPANGGILIGTVNKPNIDAGMSTVADIQWNTIGQTGNNFIYAVADPEGAIAESNENNNRALLRVDVSGPIMPDLTVSGMTFSNQTPKEGDPLALNAVIRNFGTAAGNVRINLYDGDPGTDGLLLHSHTISPIIPFGEEEQAIFNIDTVGLSGSHDFHVIVDPENAIIEQNEGNNGASAPLVINSIGLNVIVAADKPQYIENENMLITINISDLLNESRELSADVKIIDSAGAVAASLASQIATVNPLGTSTLAFIWNTGKTLTGNYLAQATVYDAALAPLARQSIPLGITSSKGIAANITADKISYYPNETVKLTSTAWNESLNSIFENLTAAASIRDTAGNVLFTDVKQVGLLAASSSYSFSSFWSTSINPTGDYSTLIEIKDASDAVLASGIAGFTISGETSPSKLLKGQISVDKQSLLQGELLSISYDITNVGNIDLSQVNISALTVHVTELTTYDTLTDQTALQMGGTYTNTQPLDTQNYSAKDYLVILRAAISGVEETLDSTYFRVEGAPSAPSLSSPANGIDVETFTPALTVNNAADPNDDELTYEFEIYSDSNLTTLIASSGSIIETANTTSWHEIVDLQENSTYYWRARAYDGLLYGNWMHPASFRVNLINESPTAPTLSSPSEDSEVDTVTPILAVNNASDPDSSNLTYNFEVSSDAFFNQIVGSSIGIFEGIGTTSWQVNVPLTDNTFYYWRAQADDWFIEGPWMTPAKFFVNTVNDAPTVPSIIAPFNGAEITTQYTDIILSNSTDPDYDPLTYAFEIDAVNTFDSPNIIRSVNIAEGQGVTSCHIDNLNDNAHYYVRSKANDGQADSQWSGVVSFFVNTVNDAPSIPVLANPSNGSGVNIFNPILSVHNSSDIDGDVLTYEFEVYEDSAMTIPVTNGIGITEAPQIITWTVLVNLIENKTYYWRARAYDRELHSGWMPLATFVVNTANDAPTAPILLSPAEGSSLDTLTPTFSVYNATDPDSDNLTYDFEIYANSVLIQSTTGVPHNISGATSVTLSTSLTDNTTYNWRASAFDGDRYGAWMDMASFSIHLPVTNITATVDFDPNTLNKKSNGKWVVVYIELPAGYNIANILISSILLNGTIPAEPWPYNLGDNDKDGIPDLMVKFNRNSVINLLPNGDNVLVEVTGTVGTTTFEGFDIIRVIP